MAYSLYRSKTNLVLVIAAIVYLSLTPVFDIINGTYYLAPIYCVIDFLTGLFIVTYGDKNKLFQASLLLGAMIIHLMLQIDFIVGSAVIINYYTQVILLITTLQLVGMGYVGSIEWPVWARAYRRKISNTFMVNH